MKIQAQSKLPSRIKQFVVFAAKGKAIQAPAPQLRDAIKDAVKYKQFSGDEGEVLALTQADFVVVLVGCGDKPEAMNQRAIGVAIKRALQTNPLTPKSPVGIVPLRDNEDWLRGVVDGAQLGLYVWDKYLSKKADPSPMAYSLTIQTKNIKLAKQLTTVADGVNLARDMANENADVADSKFIEAQIRKITRGDKRCKIEVLNRAQLQAKGLGLHLAVNQGSNKDPKLIIVTYRGGKKTDPFTALVGKGLTFDTGGLNLKPTGSMEDMRYDMCGAAAVTGTLQNTLKLNLAVNAYFVFGVAENAIGSNSYKPGDVFKSYCGMTVEIGNTDAEGRLVLADANSYVAKNYKPDAIINIATLTGAVVIALGYEHTGLMSTDDKLANALLNAAQTTDDRAWRMPMYPELKEHVKSPIADIKNIGLKRTAGTVSAGEFLRQFAQHYDENLAWAHLDIAGTAKPDMEVGYFPASGTGAGVRLLTQFLAAKRGA
ncbi:MAG: leucyl aminopeptidase [Candidatus Hinthialibacter antarcticus]|nr:leucyl aminopeptidase [Candidatus Hinthialibacter antarcticus]